MLSLPDPKVVSIVSVLALVPGVAEAQGGRPYTTAPSQRAPAAGFDSAPPPLPTMQHYRGTPGAAASAASGARTSAPGAHPSAKRRVAFPWKKNVVTTIFWVGEQPTQNNPTSNVKSAWDTRWMENFGGYDTPDPDQRTHDFRPKGFIPRQNPFYCALPYNDVEAWNKTKSEARLVIPWFKERFKKAGKSVLKGRWIAIHHRGKTCFAQWEDVGPFQTDDWTYVFSNSPPNNQHNNGAGLDVSPAVRDYLGLRSGGRCHWRFVDLHEIPDGPWKRFGDNNHFVKPQQHEVEKMQAEMERLERLRDEYLRSRR